MANFGVNMAICDSPVIPYNTRMTDKKQPTTDHGKPRKKLTLMIVKQMITLSTSGFGVVAALAWNNAIQELVTTYIKPYLSQASGLISLLVYAVLVTILAVFITYQLGRLVERLEK